MSLSRAIFRKKRTNDRLHDRYKVCFLCHHPFYSPSKYLLFCNRCKSVSERYKYSDWLSSGEEYEINDERFRKDRLSVQ